METIKMKKVLIALDYDPTSQKVAEIGFSLAKTMDAELILMHVISDPMYYTLTGHVTVMGFAGEKGTGKYTNKSIDDAKKIAQKFLESTRKHLGDDKIQILVKEGDFAKTILKTAKDSHADIIVIGSLSKKWLENIVMGSVTQEVLNYSTIPLFIVPTKKLS
ncbi:MAG: universal stress protein [Bacteroidales bacterium]